MADDSGWSQSSDRSQRLLSQSLSMLSKPSRHQISQAAMSVPGTFRSNGDDERRSACRGKPDVARVIVEGRTLSSIAHRPDAGASIQNISGLPQGLAGAL